MALAPVYIPLIAAGIGAGVSAYEGEETRKDTNRQIGAQPKPPNTSQPDESELVQQGHATAANGRGGTVLAPPMGMSPLAPMPSLGLGNPGPGTKTTTGG